MLHIYLHKPVPTSISVYAYENNSIKPNTGKGKGGRGIREYKGWCELVQCIKHTCMEFSPQNPLVLLMYTN
jgi:hypothetical protein